MSSFIFMCKSRSHYFSDLKQTEYVGHHNQHVKFAFSCVIKKPLSFRFQPNWVCWPSQPTCQVCIFMCNQEATIFQIFNQTEYVGHHNQHVKFAFSCVIKKPLSFRFQPNWVCWPSQPTCQVCIFMCNQEATIFQISTKLSMLAITTNMSSLQFHV